MAGYPKAVTLMAIVLLGLMGFQLAKLAGPARAANLSPSFPRLATLYVKNNITSSATEQAIAKNNLYITDVINWPGPSATPGETLGQYLKSQNPSQIDLVYFHSILVGDGEWSAQYNTVNGTTYYIDPRWFFTYDGSALTANVGASDTSLPVSDLSKYQVGDRVMLGGVSGQSQAELAQVTGMSASSGGGTLTVVRGDMSQNGKFPAVAHSSGDWVRTVAHAFGDGSVLLVNPTASGVSSSVNPGFGAETWNQYLASFLKTYLNQPAYSNLDGVYLDNFLDRSIQIFNMPWRVDVNNTNQPTGITDSTWTPGMQDLASKVRAALPSNWILMGNTGGQDQSTFGQWLSAGMIEGINQSGSSGLEGDTAGALAFYDGWMSAGQSPKTFIMNASPAVSSLSAGQTDYQAMRFLLTLTLTSDGYFSFDEKNIDQGHQTTWWYDEYDDAGQGTGYLGQPLGLATQPISGVYARLFVNGMSLCNTTASAQTVSLGATYQKIKGTQDPMVNDGSLVTSVTLQPDDGIILLNASGTVTPTVTATATVTPTATVTATPTPGVPPAPTGLSGGYSNGGMSLSWNGSIGATSYNVYRGWTNGRESLYQTGVTGTSFQDTNLQAGVDYWYKVTAVNSYGESAASNEIITYTPNNFTPVPTASATAGPSATSTPTATAASSASSTPTATSSASPTPTGVSSGLPAAPTNLSGGYSNGGMSLSWNGGSGATSYNVYRGWTSGHESLYQTGVTSTSFFDTNLQAGVDYWYKVTAVNASGESAGSNEIITYTPSNFTPNSATSTPAASPTSTSTPSTGAKPAPPSNLSGGYSNGGTSLSWNGSSGATSYNVYRGWTSGNESLYQSGVTSTSFRDTNVQPGIDYWYKVTAVNSAGESAPSNEIITYTPNATPTPSASPTPTRTSSPTSTPTRTPTP